MERGAPNKITPPHLHATYTCPPSAQHSTQPSAQRKAARTAVLYSHAQVTLNEGNWVARACVDRKMPYSSGSRATPLGAMG